MSAIGTKIEILVVNHKPSSSIQNSLLKPIQVGAELASQKLEGMAYYDNDGKNISVKNRSYCELTALYWAWKNLDADYYGLFHYRRYLSFSSKQSNDTHPDKAFPTLEAASTELELDEEAMRKIIEQHDLIIPRKGDTKSTTNDKTIYEQYANEHNIRDLDYCLAYIQDNYPEIAPFSKELHTSRAYFCNMFIMKKALFQDYCEFMFDVLSHFDQENDISGYSIQQYRVNGFLAERLTNIYLHYIQSLRKYSVKELQMAYIENTEPLPKLAPIVDKNNVAIVLASDNKYVPYISTLIHSIAEHATARHTYDINIFHQDITSDNMRILKGEFADRTNINIRFCDMSSRASEYRQLFTKWHFTVETYFRLFIQDIMIGYDKVLYLDGDMIVKRNVADLYNESIEGFLMGACRDIDMAGVYNSNSVASDNTIDPARKHYIDNILKIKDPYGYFQAGVILFNLDEMRKTFSTKKALEFASSREWEYLDQDVLNFFAQGKVKYLDPKWNVLYDWEFWRIKNVISKAPIGMYLEYLETRKAPSIVHYGGTIKPWHRPDCDFGDEYWKVARKSSYYELILARMGDWRAQHGLGVRPTVGLRAKVVRKMRSTADKVAPVGTVRRKPITVTSKTIKKVIR